MGNLDSPCGNDGFRILVIAAKRARIGPLPLLIMRRDEVVSGMTRP